MTYHSYSYFLGFDNEALFVTLRCSFSQYLPPFYVNHDRDQIMVISFNLSFMLSYFLTMKQKNSDFTCAYPRFWKHNASICGLIETVDSKGNHH